MCKKERISLFTYQGMQVFTYIILLDFQNCCISIETATISSKQDFNMFLKVVGIALSLGAAIFTRQIRIRSRLQPTPESQTFNTTLNEMGITFSLSTGIFVLSLLFYLHQFLGSRRPSIGDLPENTLNDSGQGLSPENQGGMNLPTISGPENAHHDLVDGALRPENEKLRSQLSAEKSLREAYRARLLGSMDANRRWEEAAMEKMQDGMQQLDCNEATEVILIE